MRKRNREEKQKCHLKENGDVQGKYGAKTDSKDDTDQTSNEPESDIFPRFLEWIVFIATLVVRISYVVQPKNWWILHPDEIFQSLEITHSEIYGYGFRPHEYLPLQPMDSVSEVRQGELRIGMHSMRSFLYPRFFIIVTWFADVIGLDITPFLLWKCAHAIVSSFLPLAVFRFAKVVYRSRDIGVLAAILASSSGHLTMFGTHTLVNSFLAPMIFWALSVIYSFFVRDNVQKNNKRCSEKHVQDVQGHLLNENNNVVDNISKTNTRATSKAGNGHSVNGHVKNGRVGNRFVGNGSMRNGHMNIGYLPTADKHTNEYLNGKIRSKTESEVMTPTWWQSDVIVTVLAGFILTLCCYIRLDVSFFTLVIFLPHTFQLLNVNRMGLIVCAVGAVIGLTVAVLDDFNAYGFGVVSPYRWLDFNVFKDFSGLIYGRMRWFHYVDDVFLQNIPIKTMSGVCVVIFIYLLLKLKTDFHSAKTRQTIKLVASLSILLVVYSAKGHKELRFLHNFLVLLYTSYSGLIVSFVKRFISSGYGRSSRFIFLSGLSMFILSQWYTFPTPVDRTNGKWSYNKMTDSNHVVQCMHYVGKRHDVTGVFVDRFIHMSGGYTVLHKKVPIFAFVHNEFFEFDNKSAKKLLSADVISSKRQISVNTFSETSNFITVYNTPLLLRVLIEMKCYNYLILPVDRKFVETGYREVFRSGTMRVIKRTFKPEEERQLELMVSDIPLGTNATVLEYEGDWLYRFKQYRLAYDRYLTAITRDPSRIGAFQMLAACAQALGNKPGSALIMEKCAEHNGRRGCNVKQERVVLHKNYMLIVK